MGRPSVESLFQPVTCYPAWYPYYLPFAQGTATVPSGCRTVDGNVQCNPAAMAAAASKALGRPVSLEAYTLARYLASEVGNGSLAEKVCVAQDAVNRVRYAEPRTGTLTALLLYRQPSGCPNRGYYGPIHDDGVAPRQACGSTSTNNPYGRWAATSRDPSIGDLVIALGVLSGDIDPWFSKGADDQLGPRALQAKGQDPVASVRNHGNRRQYWVGPIYGINPWTTFQYRTMPDISPTSAVGQALIQRGVTAMQSAPPTWTTTEPCTSHQRGGLIATATIAFGVGVGTLLWLTRRKSTVVP